MLWEGEGGVDPQYADKLNVRLEMIHISNELTI